MTAPITPVDPDSPRGRELSAELTVVLDDVEQAIAEREARRRTDDAA